MEIVDSQAQLDNYIATAVSVSGDSPVLIDQYLRDAIECDVDALCDGTQVVVAGVMQHIEEAGIHSGDSACTLPPYNLSKEVIAEMERQTEAPPTDPDDLSDRERLRRALMALPIGQRTAIVLRYFEDLSEAQTADLMGRHTGAVKSLVSRGMGTLRTTLGRKTVGEDA
jgi:RNA polymerase sigma factor (sigma-70 family)